MSKLVPAAPVISMEDAITRVGGFGKQQWISLMALVIARNSASVFAYSFAYFIIAQKYFCKNPETGEFSSCSFDEVCGLVRQGNPPERIIDKTAQHFYYDWYDELNLIECTGTGFSI